MTTSPAPTSSSRIAEAPRGDALAALLIRSGAVLAERLAAAQRRRAVYGGTLDTALLELRALDEPLLAAYLAEAAGLPPAPAGRVAAPDQDAASLMPPEEARRLRVVPLGRKEGELELALHPDAERKGLRARHLYVVPEVRFRELAALVYGERPPGRFCSLLGRLGGATEVRRKLSTGAPPAPLVETGPTPRQAPPAATEPAPAAGQLGPEPEIEIVEDDTAPGQVLETLLGQARDAENPEEAARAISLLTELRATAAVPVLIDLVTDHRRPVAASARAALTALTRQDFGDARKSWLAWWQKARGKHRMEWLLDALGHKRAELRMAAADELQAVSGVYFGYHYDLPERDREEARRRWTEWWENEGRERVESDRS
jgi:hypothetical protein